MVLIQLPLPTAETAGGSSVAQLAETRREVLERLKGVTAYVRSCAKGLWTVADGHTEADDVVMVEVVTEMFDRTWWRAHATLAQLFHQDTIHVRAMSVDMPDEGLFGSRRERRGIGR